MQFQIFLYVSYVWVLDARKAFDCVWHGGLFYKLYKCGMDKSIFKVFQNLFSGMTSCVNCKSAWLSALQGA